MKSATAVIDSLSDHECRVIVARVMECLYYDHDAGVWSLDLEWNGDTAVAVAQCLPSLEGDKTLMEVFSETD